MLGCVAYHVQEVGSWNIPLSVCFGWDHLQFHAAIMFGIIERQWKWKGRIILYWTCMIIGMEGGHLAQEIGWLWRNLLRVWDARLQRHWFSGSVSLTG